MAFRKLFRAIFNNWHVKILSLLMAILLVYFNNIIALEDRVIVVPLMVRLSPDYVPANEVPSSVRINLRGESEEIVSIVSEDIVAMVDLRPYASPGSYSATVQIERRGDALNIDPLQVSSQPEQVSIQIEERMSKEVGVTADVRGAVAAGYDLVEVAVAPAAVTISGPRSMIERIGEVATESIDITNHNASSSARAVLVPLGEYITFEDSASVSVRFEIEEVPIVRALDGLEIVIENLNDRFAVQYAVPETFLQVRGLISELDRLENQTVALVVEAEGINAIGMHEVPVALRLPEGQEAIEVLEYRPREITLVVNRR